MNGWDRAKIETGSLKLGWGNDVYSHQGKDKKIEMQNLMTQ